MKKRVYGILLIIFIFICNINCNNKTNIRKACTKYSSCEEIFVCYKENVNLNNIRKGYDSICDQEKLMKCTANILSTNKEARKLLLTYYSDYYESSIEHKCIPAEIATIYYDYDVETFSKLRGKEAFVLALKYASKTDCVDLGDQLGGGNIGYNVIKYVCYPMIKSVGGYGSLDEYLWVENGKNRTFYHLKKSPSLKLSDRCLQGDYEYYYNELLKAYNEGKVVLKKYGSN